MRETPWRTPARMRRDHLLTIVMNHDVYHSGEINRQRALIRGAQGWDRDPLRRAERGWPKAGGEVAPRSRAIQEPGDK